MNSFSIWAVIPAAGIGRRMQSDIPKQYLQLLGASVLANTIRRLLAADKISGLAIALRDDDQYWPKVEINSAKPVLRAKGGGERCDSVLSAMKALAQHENFDINNDWVLVHDAVRPCVRLNDIEQLIAQATLNDAGGLLALPVRDTMKRQTVGSEMVQQTVEREGLWHALTPQLFPCGVLQNALVRAMAEGIAATDESSAMELSGYAPLLVEGCEDNIKITRPGDLRLAELFMADQQAQEDL
ncbi:MAG: 2-C-methyl-D-erythritol 4-phosphate cytidylyltransferase [Gammaproteobacteria bacterium]|jgi:2-C-methyl-D-erythritol 4-phosphate cytidylyltransferase|nr:2-C-methyl-D-erythritol 4-phosphate cytidylyltransferase [Gammaproteobacteria bacterium]